MRRGIEGADDKGRRFGYYYITKSEKFEPRRHDDTV
jgi:hypothetical protein